MCAFRCFFKAIHWFGNFLQPFFLLAIRLLWGLGFFHAGFEKFQDMDKVIGFFTQLDIPSATFMAYLVATVETVGGLFIFFGFASRFAAIPLAITMMTALGTVDREASLAMFQNFSSNFQSFSTLAPVGYLLTAMTVLCFGPGLFSLDALLRKMFCKESC